MMSITEGKTKRIVPWTVVNGVCREARATSKNRVTWDNAWEADMPGKAAWSTETTCNVFGLLEKCGVGVAFYGRRGEDAFLAPYCRMIPLEVVGRAAIDPRSSFLKRNPGYPRVGEPLEVPEVEFFLKSKDRLYKGIALSDDDPLVVDEIQGGVGPAGFSVIHPAGKDGNAFIPHEAFGDFGMSMEALLKRLRPLAGDATLFLRDAWARLGWQLVDVKFEFGFDYAGQLLLADVVDNDSWRLRDPEGRERSKQVVRDLWGKWYRASMSDDQIKALKQAVIVEASPSFELVAEMSARLLRA